MCDRCIHGWGGGPLLSVDGLDKAEELMTVFFNLGLMQADIKMDRRRRWKLCGWCKAIDSALHRCVSNNVATYYLLEKGVVNCVYDFWSRTGEKLVADVLRDGKIPGRVFVLLTCFSRAGKVWRESGASFGDVEVQVKLFRKGLIQQLPSFDWKEFERWYCPKSWFSFFHKNPWEGFW